jgi:hypothetical protein
VSLNNVIILNNTLANQRIALAANHWVNIGGNVFRLTINLGNINGHAQNVVIEADVSAQLLTPQTIKIRSFPLSIFQVLINDWYGVDLTNDLTEALTNNAINITPTTAVPPAPSTGLHWLA